MLLNLPFVLCKRVFHDLVVILMISYLKQKIHLLFGTLGALLLYVDCINSFEVELNSFALKQIGCICKVFKYNKQLFKVARASF